MTTHAFWLKTQTVMHPVGEIASCPTLRSQTRRSFKSVLAACLRVCAFSWVCVCIRVRAVMLFIASIGDEAEMITEGIPRGHAFVCLDMSRLPQTMREIFTQNDMS